MTIKVKRLVCMGSTALVLPLLLAVGFNASAADTGSKVAAEGKKIAFSRKKGNCLACHMMSDGQMPGNIAPPLIGMKGRYADKAKLRAQIYDPEVANPETTMPPFGKHNILSDKELDKVVEFVWTL